MMNPQRNALEMEFAVLTTDSQRLRESFVAALMSLREPGGLRKAEGYRHQWLDTLKRLQQLRAKLAELGGRN